MDALSSDLIDHAVTCRLIGGDASPIHKSTLFRGVREGRFPKPLKIGPGTVRWRRSEIEAFLEKAAAARGAA